MSMPLITKEEIITYLRSAIVGSPIVEISGIYPAEDTTVPYGIYVMDVMTARREVNQGSVTYCGAIYNCFDAFNIKFVSFQDDPNSEDVQGVIQRMAQNTSFFNGYRDVTYNHDELIGNRSEIHTYNFEMRRIEYNL